jgi:predicted O-methyltransferase YrrM
MNITKEKLKNLYGKVRSIGRENNSLPHDDFIVSFAKILKPKVYVELGVYECLIVNKMIPFVSETVYAVDIKKEAGLFLKKNKKAVFFNGTTDDFAKELKKKNVVIDMIFIDADHRKESVLTDFKNYFPLVKEDGIIFLHDGYPKDLKQTEDGYCSNCWEAIAELSKHTETYEMMTIPLQPGLTICRKRTKQIPWK